MLLLAKSQKYNNYCVAGIDIANNKLVRLVSNDENIHNALTPEDMEYKEGGEAEVGELVEVVIDKRCPDCLQPENIMINTGQYIKKIKDDEISFENYECNKEYVFYDTSNKIHTNELQSKDDVYSLQLIKAEVVEVNVRYYSDSQRYKVYMDFCFNGRCYNNFSITDAGFRDYYINSYIDTNQSNYCFDEDLLLLVSLGEVYDGNSCHYKLVASVMSV